MKTYISVAMAASLSCGAAIAQSSVTLYGVADQFLGYGKSNLASKTTLSDGGAAASRFGFKGNEDLGSGMTAGFYMESVLNMNSGAVRAGGVPFFRDAYIRLAGSFGAVSLGRQPSPFFIATAQGDPFNYNEVFTPLYVLAATNGQPGLAVANGRPDNTVRYRTPEMGGFFGDASWSFGGAASSTTTSQRSGDVYSGALGWQTPTVFASLSHQRQLSGTAAAPVASPTTSSFTALTGSYRVTDALKISGNFMRTSLDVAGVAKANTLALGATYQVTGNSRVLIEAVRRKVSDGSPIANTAWTAGYDYDLSRRTSLYARLLNQRNSGGATSLLGSAAVPQTAAGASGVSLFGVGIRHTF